MARPNSWESLLDAWEPRLQRAFLDSIANLRNTAHIDQIVRMLERGDVTGALQAVGIDPVAFRPFDKTIASAFEAGGEATAASVPISTSASGFRTVFQFSVRNPAAEAWLRDYSGNLIREIVDDQRTAVRNFLDAGLSQGANPRTTALDLVGRISQATGRREGGIIGLTSSQEEWVRNYRAELESNNPAEALQRSLRDARFDKAVARASASGEQLDKALVDKMVKSYTNRALRFRAEAIARSETITALHEAQNISMRQAINSGKVSASQIKSTWRDARDKRVREAHRELSGHSVPFGGTFHSKLGPIRYPGDPSATAANRIGCRCWLEMKVDHLGGIR